MSIEDELRQVLADPRYAPQGWPEAAEQVRAGMRRRRRRRVALGSGVVTVVVVAATAVSVALVRGPGGPPPTGPDRVASPSTEAGTVPWRDLPAVGQVERTLSPRPAAAPCRSSNLVVDGVDVDGAGGTLFNTVRVHNAGPARCTLSGRPTLLRKDSRTIRATPVPQVGHGGPAATPATIDPREQAEVAIRTYGGCLDGRTETTYGDVRLRLSDGGQLRLRISLNVTCGVGIEQWHRPAPPPSADPLTALTVAIEAPPSVRVGQTLAFVVILGNPTDAPIALERCPDYLTYVDSAAKIAASRQLNCAVPAIPAHGRVQFAMRLPIVPQGPVSGTLAGPTTLVWSMGDTGSQQATAPITLLDG
jgi:hypothetical protein